MEKATGVERIDKYDTLSQDVFKVAKEAGLKGGEYDEEDGKYWLTAEYEESILQDFKEEYDNETFWNDLPNRFAERDMERKFGTKAIAAMDNEKRFKEHMAICHKYELEFEKNGIENAQIKGLDK